MKTRVIDSYKALVQTMRSISELMTALQASADVKGFAAAERAHRAIAEARKELHPVLSRYADTPKR